MCFIWCTALVSYGLGLPQYTAADHDNAEPGNTTLDPETELNDDAADLDLDSDPRYNLIRLHKNLDHFLQWTVVESLEALPSNHLCSLLLVNRRFNALLGKVLDDALGRHADPRDRYELSNYRPADGVLSLL